MPSKKNPQSNPEERSNENQAASNLPHEDSKRLSEELLELKSRYSDIEECNRLRLAIIERRRYLMRCYPGANEINECNQAESRLESHTRRIAEENTQIAERLGLSSRELSLRLRASHHLEDWKAAQKTPVTELPLAEFWLRVQSFLIKLDAQRRSLNSMAPPMTELEREKRAEAASTNAASIVDDKARNTLEAEPSAVSQRRELIYAKILSNPNGTIRTEQAAVHYEVVPKTIRGWANGKVKGKRLQWGTRRGTILNSSILKLDKSLKKSRKLNA